MGAELSQTNVHLEQDEEASVTKNAGDFEGLAAAKDKQAIFTRGFTQEHSLLLQESVDEIFGTDGDSLHGLKFSFTIADPSIEGCPLIGCSHGFTELCGYELNDIVGHNCKFLMDGVPSELLDNDVRNHAREFCEAVNDGQNYVRPEEGLKPWMPRDRPQNELLCMQTNARKDGTLFNNMFLLKTFELSLEFGDERPFIVGLQSDLKGGSDALEMLSKNLDDLDSNMQALKAVLCSQFYVSTPLERQ